MRLLLDGEPRAEQRQLAVDRLDRRRPGAVLPAHVQPGDPAAQFDPDGDYVRRWVPELRDVPDATARRAVDDERRGAAAAGCVIGERLPGADRRPRAGAAAWRWTATGPPPRHPRAIGRAQARERAERHRPPYAGLRALSSRL